MIDETRVTYICIAQDCRRTGRPRFDGRDFVCTKCLGVCDSALLTKHTEAASRLLGAEKIQRSRPSSRNADAVARAEFVELRAWRALRGQVIERCGVKTKTVEGA